MNQRTEAFLSILRASLTDQIPQGLDGLAPEDWQAMTALAAEQKLLPLFAEAVHTISGAQEVLSAHKPFVRQQVMVQALKTREFLELYQTLTDAGIRPLVVKGILCRNLYPKPDHRPSSDEDILVSPEQFEEARRILEASGLTLLSTQGNPNELPYRKTGGSLYIELHRALFPPESDAYGDWNRFFTDIWDHAVWEEIQGIPVLSPEPTAHLFYLIAHALKHFLHSGFGIRQVCDVSMYASAYGSRIDWERLLGWCAEIRAVDFAAAMFRISEKYLAFDPELACCPEALRARQIDEIPMLEDLLAGGVYGTASMNRLHSSNMTLTAAAASKQGKQTGASVLASLFPGVKKLESGYPYLKKRPWLLPVAWCQRIVKYGAETGQNADSSALDAVKIGKERVELLRLYGVIGPEPDFSRKRNAPKQKQHS